MQGTGHYHDLWYGKRASVRLCMGLFCMATCLPVFLRAVSTERRGVREDPCDWPPIRIEVIM